MKYILWISTLLCSVSAFAETRPNVLLIHAHDLGQHLGCYGVQTVQSPNIDRLASEGVRFAVSFCTNPGCSPSRASMFTGRYPHCNGVMGLVHGQFDWDLKPDEVHLARMLRDAGYRTAAIGNVHECQKPAERGYEIRVAGSQAKPATDKAIEWLKKFAEHKETPYYMSLGYIEPHRLPTGGGLKGYPGIGLQPDDSKGVYVPGYLKDTPGTCQELAGLQGSIKHMDAQVGRLLEALKALGLEQQTLVIFTTDHGIAMPRAKCAVYDPGIEVAFILRYPGRKGWTGGVVKKEMLSNVDYVPTILDCVGLPIPERVQGQSVAPLLDGKAGYKPRQEIFAELTYHNYYDPRRTIRTETHKLIVNFSTAPAYMSPTEQWQPLSSAVAEAVADTPDVELYDLAKDRWELKNVAEKPEYAEVRKDLMGRLWAFMKATGDPLLRGAVACPQHSRAMEKLQGAK
jgi:arylsulfatase A-like enzyme